MRFGTGLMLTGRKKNKKQAFPEGLSVSSLETSYYLFLLLTNEVAE